MKQTVNNHALIHFSMLAFYILLVTRNSWVSDDAMITFRVVENFLAGYGLGFNPYVRVQVFTHPLWMLTLSFLYFIQRLFVPASPNALFYITIFLSLALSFFTIFLLITKVSQESFLSKGLAVLILSLSNGFVDFSTSGLENPLTHLLLILFFLGYIAEKLNLFFLAFIGALIMLNRLDVFLMIFPAIAYSWWVSKESQKGLLKILAGFTPIMLWEVFSLFYFGFPFPNTAYAKLSTGISGWLLIQQGLDYLLNSINWEPILLFSVGFAGACLYLNKNTKLNILYFGVLLYIVYIVKIGGDFMSGRFLTAPLIVSVAIISATVTRTKDLIAGLSVVLLLGVFSVRSTLVSSNTVLYQSYPIGDNNGISDQRLYYFGNFQEGQFNSFVENGFRDTLLGSDFAGEKWYFTGFKKVILTGALGKPAYQKGPNFYYIDDFALSDPLLARLPVLNKYWQIGHFHRDLPQGYYETLETNQNQIVDPDLAFYYSKLDILVRGRLHDWNRLIEILKFNTGQYDYLLDRYNSRNSK